MRFLRSLKRPVSSLCGVALLGCGCLALFSGCDRVEGVQHYTVAKPEVLAKRYFGDSRASRSPASRDGMLGAIVPRGERLWFFKLQGTNDAVMAQATTFARFIGSLTFGDGPDSPPEWELPDGWHQQPGSGMRFATIEVEAKDAKLELSVTTFPKPEGDEESAVLMNINRWRGQLGLAPIGKNQLSENTKTVNLPFGRAVIVGLEGHLQGGGMGGPMAGGPGSATAQFATGPFARAPFDGGKLPADHPALPADHPPIDLNQESGSEPAAAEESSGITYQAPAGWKPEARTPMRKAAFVVEKDQEKVEITVIALPPFAGNVLDNVNRWRGQLHLGGITAADLPKQVEWITVGDTRSAYVKLVGTAEPPPKQAVFGVLAARGEQVWFVKLMGDAALAERERANFEGFLKTIKFKSS